jgi:curved DNA-binding protein CbpA
MATDQKLRTHYDNLQVSRAASAEVIRAAYRTLAQRWHPDRNPQDRPHAEWVTRIINVAYEVLSDPTRRAEHDSWIEAHEQHHPEAVERAHVTAEAPSPPAHSRESPDSKSSEPSIAPVDWKEWVTGEKSAATRHPGQERPETASGRSNQSDLSIFRHHAQGGLRWSKNSLVPFALYAAVKIYSAFKTGELKELVEAGLIFAAGIFCACIAFPLGYLYTRAISRQR